MGPWEPSFVPGLADWQPSRCPLSDHDEPRMSTGPSRPSERRPVAVGSHGGLGVVGGGVVTGASPVPVFIDVQKLLFIEEMSSSWATALANVSQLFSDVVAFWPFEGHARGVIGLIHRCPADFFLTGRKKCFTLFCFFLFFTF